MIAGGRLFRLLDGLLAAVALVPAFNLGFELSVFFRGRFRLIDALRGSGRDRLLASALVVANCMNPFDVLIGWIIALDIRDLDMSGGKLAAKSSNPRRFFFWTSVKPSDRAGWDAGEGAGTLKPLVSSDEVSAGRLSSK